MDAPRRRIGSIHPGTLVIVGPDAAATFAQHRFVFNVESAWRYGSTPDRWAHIQGREYNPDGSVRLDVDLDGMVGGRQIFVNIDGLYQAICRCFTGTCSSRRHNPPAGPLRRLTAANDPTEGAGDHPAPGAEGYPCP